MCVYVYARVRVCCFARWTKPTLIKNMLHPPAYDLLLTFLFINYIAYLFIKNKKTVFDILYTNRIIHYGAILKHFLIRIFPLLSPLYNLSYQPLILFYYLQVVKSFKQFLLGIIRIRNLLRYSYNTLQSRVLVIKNHIHRITYPTWSIVRFHCHIFVNKSIVKVSNVRTHKLSPMYSSSVNSLKNVWRK